MDIILPNKRCVKDFKWFSALVNCTWKFVCVSMHVYIRRNCSVYIIINYWLNLYALLFHGLKMLLAFKIEQIFLKIQLMNFHCLKVLLWIDKKNLKKEKKKEDSSPLIFPLCCNCYQLLFVIIYFFILISLIKIKFSWIWLKK